MARYDGITDLPDQVRKNLPERAQIIYRDAFNNAWDVYSEPDEHKGGAKREQVSHRVAWYAVMEEYQKQEDGKWVKK